VASTLTRFIPFLKSAIFNLHHSDISNPLAITQHG
jgi:hypothetical protein